MDVVSKPYQIDEDTFGDFKSIFAPPCSSTIIQPAILLCVQVYIEKCLSKKHPDQELRRG